MATIESRLNDLELRVYDFIRLRGWGGATTDEIEIATGLSHQCASARVSELEHKHKLIERRASKRKTRSGRSAFIYVVAGLSEAREREDHVSRE